jgi:PhnB protein
MTAINSYLHFNGKAEEAFNFYKSVFGGEFAALMRFGDMPGCGEMPISEADKQNIMHIALPIGAAGGVLMGGDTPEAMGQLTPGNNFSIAISPASRDEADRIFNDLAEGGKIEMPLADAFWGGYFGGLQDRFGVSWMVNYDENNSK